MTDAGPFCKVFYVNGQQCMAYVRPMLPSLVEDQQWYQVATATAQAHGQPVPEMSSLERLFIATRRRRDGAWIEVTLTGPRDVMSTGFAAMTDDMPARFVAAAETTAVEQPGVLARQVSLMFRSLAEQAGGPVPPTVDYAGRA